MCPTACPTPRDRPGTATAALPFDHIVVVMMENHSFDNLLGALSRSGQPKAQGPALQRRRRRPSTATRARTGRVRSFPFPITAQGPNVSQTGTPPTSRSTAAGWTASCARSTPTSRWATGPTRGAAVRLLARAHLHASPTAGSARRPARPTQPPLPDGRHGLRQHLHRHRKPQRPAAAERHDLGSPARLRDQLAQLLHRSALDGDHPVDDREVPDEPRADRRSSSPTARPARLPSVSLVDPEFGVARRSSARRSRRCPALAADRREKLETTGGDEENPQDMSYGEYWAYQAVKAVLESPAWPRTLLIYTYDEHGGYYDHVPPPAAIAPDSIPPELGPGDVAGRLRHLRPARARGRRLALLQAERGHERRPRPHLRAGDDRGEVEPAGADLPRRQREDGRWTSSTSSSAAFLQPPTIAEPPAPVGAATHALRRRPMPSRPAIAARTRSPVRGAVPLAALRRRSRWLCRRGVRGAARDALQAARGSATCS